MKKLIVFAASLMMTLPVWAQLPSAGPDAAEPDSDKNPMSAVYKSYENRKGVSTVYISKDMFSLMSTIMSQTEGSGAADMLVGDVEDESVDISKIFGFMDKLRGMYLMQTDEPKDAYSINWSVEQIINSKKNEYRELMQVSDGGDRIVFYYVTPDGKYVDEFLMLQTEVDDTGQPAVRSCTVIQFIAEGLTIQDIAALAAEMTKDSQ